MQFGDMDQDSKKWSCPLSQNFATEKSVFRKYFKMGHGYTENQQAKISSHKNVNIEIIT